LGAADLSRAGMIRNCILSCVACFLGTSGAGNGGTSRSGFTGDRIIRRGRGSSSMGAGDTAACPFVAGKMRIPSYFGLSAAKLIELAKMVT